MTYQERLAEAWQAHLAPRADDAPTVISTFAGCGGSSLGYSMAGFRELLAVEWDQNAVDTFRLNFPEVPVYHGDIAKLSVEDVLVRTDLRPGELDVFDGSPPCQGFSTAGKRMMHDSRNQLFREYVRLLQGLQPRVFVMENVSGMVKGKMKLLFAEILRELKACGYRVSARLMNAMYFNVPQSRPRMIFIGIRDDCGIEPSHPSAQQRPIILRDALESVVIDYEERTKLLDAGQRYASYARWRELKPGQRVSDLTGIRGFSGIKLDPSAIAPTILKSEGELQLYGTMHWQEQRRPLRAEYKRIASFPDEFAFVGPIGNAIERIGNSVPPLFMRAVAEHIRTKILAQVPAIAIRETVSHA
jgi:DNA (cytosine-5)-methyltransferase 1